MYFAENFQLFYALLHVITSSLLLVLLAHLLDLDSIEVISLGATVNLEDMSHVKDGLQILEERVVDNFYFDAEVIA
jgi:hypothetical protein